MSAMSAKGALDAIQKIMGGGKGPTCKCVILKVQHDFLINDAACA